MFPAPRYIKTREGLQIYTESFGEPADPVVILIMGAMNQGIFWYDSFCETLSKRRLFVIRFDHRDTGFSSTTDFQKHPYNLEDLAVDVLDIMDGYGLPKAHIVGISMGGYIGQILAAHHHERIETLTLISTTADHRPYMDAVAGDLNKKYELPYPGREFIAYMESSRNHAPKNDKEFRDGQIGGWKIFFGQETDEADMNELIRLIDLSNEKNKSRYSPFNHGRAVSNSCHRSDLVKKIIAPTLIIHGDQDVCFSKEHGQFLAKHIPDSQIDIVRGMGHMFTLGESKIIAEKIIKHIKAKQGSIARVTVEYRGAYKVKNPNGEFLAKVTGKQMFNASSREDYPAVGDWVAITELNAEQAVIHEVLPRKTMISRNHRDKSRGDKKSETQVIAANIDEAFIVESVDRDFNLNRFERYVVIAKDGGVKPVLILNKVDLLSKEELDAKLRDISDRFDGIEIIKTSSVQNDGLLELKKHIENGKTYCFLGSSGVGKSSLINRLLGKDMIRTESISLRTGRGKHATTRREMYFLDNGGIVIDNPGMREVGMTDAGASIDNLSDEIAALAAGCKFTDCTHVHEHGCEVLAALNAGKLDTEKYSNYINLKKESEHYEMTELEKRQRDHEFGKSMKAYKKQFGDRDDRL